MPLRRISLNRSAGDRLPPSHLLVEIGLRRRKARMSPVEPVTVTINGVTYVGTYYVQRSRIHVHSAYGSKSAQFGGGPPEAIARMLLAELVRAGSSTD
jgi:hypothetical protein